jgi:hypothetical protein
MRLDRFIGKVGDQAKFSIIQHEKNDEVVHVNDPVDDFVVLKLKDINTAPALFAYAESAEQNNDHELAADMRILAERALAWPNRKMQE